MILNLICSLLNLCTILVYRYQVPMEWPRPKSAAKPKLESYMDLVTVLDFFLIFTSGKDLNFSYNFHEQRSYIDKRTLRSLLLSFLILLALY